MGLSYNAVGAIIFALFALYGALLMFLFVRFRRAQRRYLLELPPVEGVPLDMYWGGGPWSVTRALFRAMREPQSDPALEQLRREARRRGRAHILFGTLGGVVWFGLSLVVMSLQSVR